MRTLTVNLKIVTSAPGDENLSEVVASVLKQMAEHPDISCGGFESGQEFTFRYTSQAQKEVMIYQAIEPHDQLHAVMVDRPEQTFVATVIGTYENSDV